MTDPASLQFREDIASSDASIVRDIVTSTGFFNKEEIDIAVELVEERLERGEASGYYFIFAQTHDGSTVGYACYGPIGGTKSSFDLYWIAVREEMRGKGLGPVIMKKAEEAMARMGARRIYAETSSRAQYKPTQDFYKKQGYFMEALLVDFYAEGDGKMIFVKKIG